MASQEGSNTDFGYFVSSDDKNELWLAVEPADAYDEGVYYPICIGEILDQRYLVQHKLGHGGFSTVWMAYDCLQRKDVALKITRPGEDSEYEHWIQDEIIQATDGESGLVTYERTFQLLTPAQACHEVFVFPLYGPNLQVCLRTRPIAARMSAAKYLLQALKALHDAEIVHRGKLS
jgi:serine/threonine protein kinase